MARLKSNSLQGPFTGKLGNIVGCRWKDTYYIRTRPERVNHPNTEKQLAQRMRFVNTQEFLLPLKEFLRLGFSAYTANKSAYNAAMSHNMKNALEGVYPDIVVSPSKVLVSKGLLPGKVKAVIRAVGSDTVRFFWNNTESSPVGHENDRVLLVVRARSEKLSDYRVDAARRSDGEAEIRLTQHFRGKEVDCYLIFVSQEVLLGTISEEGISNSIYCGTTHIHK